MQPSKPEISKPETSSETPLATSELHTSVLAEKTEALVQTSDSVLTHYLKALGERIVALRKERKISQHSLAIKAGLDRAYISSVENGKQNVTVGAIAKLAVALEVRIEDLLVGFKIE